MTGQNAHFNQSGLKRFLMQGIVTRDHKMVINGVGKTW